MFIRGLASAMTLLGCTAAAHAAVSIDFTTLHESWGVIAGDPSATSVTYERDGGPSFSVFADGEGWVVSPMESIASRDVVAPDHASAWHSTLWWSLDYRLTMTTDGLVTDEWPEGDEYCEPFYGGACGHPTGNESAQIDLLFGDLYVDPRAPYDEYYSRFSTTWYQWEGEGTYVIEGSLYTYATPSAIPSTGWDYLDSISFSLAATTWLNSPVTAVPEPSMAALWLLGGVGVAGAARRRRAR